MIMLVNGNEPKLQISVARSWPYSVDVVVIKLQKYRLFQHAYTCFHSADAYHILCYLQRLQFAIVLCMLFPQKRVDSRYAVSWQQNDKTWNMTRWTTILQLLFMASLEPNCYAQVL